MEADVNIDDDQEHQQPNEALIRHFQKNISPRVPPHTIGIIGIELGFVESDVKHLIEFDATVDALFTEFLSRHQIGVSVHRIIQALRTVKLVDLADEVTNDMKSGLWNNESDMHIF